MKRGLMMDEKKYLLKHLKEHAYKKGNFKLASGKTSDFYIDCKKTLLRSHMLRLSGQLINQVIFDYLKDDKRLLAVVGTGVGGGPLAAAVSYSSAYPYGVDKCGLDVVYVRSSRKDHGAKKLVEGYGHLPKNAGVVIVEDVTTTGGSVFKAIEALNERNLKTLLVVTVVDRLEGAKLKFEKSNIPFISIFTKHDFMEL